VGRRAQVGVCRHTSGFLADPHALGSSALALGGQYTTLLLADFVLGGGGGGAGGGGVGGWVFLGLPLVLEFSLPRMWPCAWEVLGVGGAQLLITTGIIAAARSMLFDVAGRPRGRLVWRTAMPRPALIIGNSRSIENIARMAAGRRQFCLFQDLIFSLLLALVSALKKATAAAPQCRASLGRDRLAAASAALVAGRGRWLLRPLFLMIASVRSRTVLVGRAARRAVLGLSTHAAGLSLRSAAFSPGMMLCRNLKQRKFRHQVEATIWLVRAKCLLGFGSSSPVGISYVGFASADFGGGDGHSSLYLLYEATVVAVVANRHQELVQSLRTGDDSVAPRR